MEYPNIPVNYPRSSREADVEINGHIAQVIPCRVHVGGTMYYFTCSCGLHSGCYRTPETVVELWKEHAEQ